ncbi:glycosyltransferase family 2 protein [Lactobacillus reuteri]|uniref:glycosyltransferase family 2 protein n=1 Tax=Limosilactobacillus reuteri TaxID=1598 RepID=UPI001652A188|nr:glycosyltransferase family 2 protein [Limosilactobacillus reuteri]MBC6910259.1 glycosyltransferase family 2 protein [Limosilactobacillus reuteri]
MGVGSELLVTIVVPVYNDEKFLRKCLTSIRNQTHKKIEVILIDDGSTDKSAKVISSFTEIDPRFHYFHKKNSGVSNSRNIGIEKARGEYICFSDADDILSDTYVEYLLNLSLKYNSDISLTTKMFDNFNMKQVVHENIRSITPEEATINIMNYNIPIGVYSKLFRTKFLKEYNLKFNEKLYMGEGFNFNVASFQRAKSIVCSDRKIYFYRRNNSNSATTKFSVDKCNNELEAINLLKENLILNSKNINKAWEFARWRTYSDVFDILVLAKQKSNYPELYKTCKKVIRSSFFHVLGNNISYKNKIRAIVIAIFPLAIPWAMNVRNKKYKVNVEH